MRVNIRYEDTHNIYLYNTFTGAFASVKPEYQKVVIELLKNQTTNINPQNLPADLFNDLQQGGYIIPSGFDELEYLKTLNMIWRFGSSSLSLTICPTLECNFVCSYCYEKKEGKKGQMDDLVANSIIKFIEKESEERIKRLNIVWYGGEPMLALPRIESLMSNINSICDKQHVKLSVFLVTNGYLLDDSYLSRLKKCGILSMQITLDGVPDVHNKRRRLVNGGPTFETVYNNIIRTLHNDFHISIRVNTDRENISSIPFLFEILAKDDIIRERGLPYMGQTISGPKGCSDFPDDYCLSVSEFAKERYLMQHKLIELGFKSGIRPRPKANFCQSIGTGGYVIDPFGNLYKCWMDVGSLEFAVGKLENNGEIVYDKIKILKWLSYNPFGDAECLNCKILPLCVGGCYYYPVRVGKRRCSELKYRLKDYLFLNLSQKKV